MEVYTLAPDFQRNEIIEGFKSFIWTERYSSSGDTKLVVPATSEMISQLAEGTFLSIPETKEVMIIETQSIENNLLTVTGDSLLGFLKNRIIRTSIDPKDRYWNFSGLAPAHTLSIMVQQVLIEGFYVDPGGTNYGVGQELNKIPGLRLGPLDTTGEIINVAIPFGSMYDGLRSIAESYEIGIKLYLDSADSSEYILRFRAYRGIDRTSDQTENPVVRFSPNMDSLTDVKELRSIAGYKTVAYAFAPGLEGMTSTGIAFAPGIAADTYDEFEGNLPGDSYHVGFNRRSLIVLAEDITTDLIGGNETVLKEILDERAKDALANNNYAKILDGEVVPQNEFQYGVHYGIGDIIELQGHSGLLQKARITEYVRTQDETGVREYPTVSVID